MFFKYHMKMACGAFFDFKKHARHRDPFTILNSTYSAARRGAFGFFRQNVAISDDFLRDIRVNMLIHIRHT